MRGAVVIACVIGAAPAAAAPAPPPLIGQAIKDAAAVGHPLVVELHARWCRPCRWFADHVLPRPEVQRALEAVDFLRYDIDTAEGEAVVKRYRTTAVPTFLVLDANGVVVQRVAGLQGRGAVAADAEDTVAAWFVDLVGDARHHTDELTEIEHAIHADPRDPAARLRLARYYRGSELRPQAVEAYRAIVDAEPPMTGAEVALAAAELDDLVAAEKRIADAVASAMRYAKKYPDARQTTGRLALAAASGAVSAEEIHALLGRHLEAVTPGASLAEAIRLALGLRMRDLADTAIARWRARFPDAALLGLVDVEIAVLDGDYPAAARRLRPLCTDPPPGIELQCYVLASAIKETWRGAPGVRRLLSTATSYLHGLDVPGEGASIGGMVAIEDLVEVDLELGNAVARSLRVAARRCADRAERRATVSVAVRLDDEAGRPEAVKVLSREVGAVAQRCVADFVGAQPLPRAAVGVDGTLVGEIDLAPARSYFALPPRLGGTLFTGFARGGELTALGVGAQGVVGLGPVADFRSMVRWEVELGIDDSEATTAAARGMFGLGIGSDRWQFAALVGAGASRAGRTLPGAIELPFELRLDGAIGPSRLHLWARGAWLYGATARRPEDGSALFGADETAFGAAFGLARNRLYIGAALEQRAAGRCGVFLLGLPVGGFF